MGKAVHACEGTSTYETLEFEFINSEDMPNKPGLLGGNGSERLGLIQFNMEKEFANSILKGQTTKLGDTVTHS